MQYLTELFITVKRNFLFLFILQLIQVEFKYETGGNSGQDTKLKFVHIDP